MRQRYHVLRVFIIVLNVAAFVVPLDMIYRWYEARSLLIQMIAQLNQATDQLTLAYNQLNQSLGSLASSWGIPYIAPNGLFSSSGSTVLDLTEQDIRHVVSAIVVGIALWALSEYLRAHLSIEENTRGAVALLWRLVHHQVPTEEPAYMRSLHGVWDEASAARIPDEHWKRTPVPAAKAVNLTEVIEKRQDYLRPKDQLGKPEPNYKAFRRPNGNGDPPSW